ncbi:MAG: flagellar hook protein FlgE [Huintestinicola sp.]
MVRSLYSGVAGLTSHQTRMDVIGNNIANVNTYGFKASRTSFADIYYQAKRNETGGSATFAGNNPSTVGYGVQVASIDKDMSMSSFQNTGRTLDLAIAGDGFFICGTLDRNAQVNGVTYTRMGNFGIDSNGNLVNAQNEFILGTRNKERTYGGTYSSVEMNDTDPADKPNELDTLNINKLIWDAYKPECEIDYDEVESVYKTGTPTIFSDRDPYDTTRTIAYAPINNAAPAAFADDRMTDYVLPNGTTGAQVATDFVLYSVNGRYVNAQGVEYDPKTGYFLDEDGNYYQYNAVTDKDANGVVTKTYTYALVTGVDPNTPFSGTVSTNAWEIYTYDKNSDTFRTTDQTNNTIYADMTDGSLKYSDLDAFTIGADGIITAQYASTMKSLARIEVATFDNVEGLREAGDTEFIQTTASGEANIKRPGDSGAGEVQSSKLEMSNVNLAGEFSDMIVTQRGFQANARIITTSDSMLEELVNLKR